MLGRWDATLSSKQSPNQKLHRVVVLEGLEGLLLIVPQDVMVMDTTVDGDVALTILSSFLLPTALFLLLLLFSQKPLLLSTTSST